MSFQDIFLSLIHISPVPPGASIRDGRAIATPPLCKICVKPRIGCESEHQPKDNQTFPGSPVAGRCHLHGFSRISTKGVISWPLPAGLSFRSF